MINFVEIKSSDIKDLSECGANKTSYVTIAEKETNSYEFKICLSTTDNAWLAASREQLDDKDAPIFYGKAAK